MASFDDFINSNTPQNAPHDYRHHQQQPGQLQDQYTYDYTTYDYNQNSNQSTANNRCSTNRYQPPERNTCRDGQSYGCNMQYQTRPHANMQASTMGPHQYEARATGNIYKAPHNQPPCSSQLGNYPPQIYQLPRLDYIPEDTFAPECRQVQRPPIKQANACYQSEYGQYLEPCNTNVYRPPDCDFRLPPYNGQVQQHRNVGRDFPPRPMPQMQLPLNGLLPCASTPLEIPAACRPYMQPQTRHGSLIYRPRMANFKCSDGYLAAGRLSKEPDKPEPLPPIFPATQKGLRETPIPGRASRQKTGRRSKTPMDKDHMRVSEEGPRIDTKGYKSPRRDERLTPLETAKSHAEGRKSVQEKTVSERAKSPERAYGGKEEISKFAASATQQEDQSKVSTRRLTSPGQPHGERVAMGSEDVKDTQHLDVKSTKIASPHKGRQESAMEAQGPPSSYEVEIMGSDRLVKADKYDDVTTDGEYRSKYTEQELKDLTDPSFAQRQSISGEQSLRRHISSIHGSKEMHSSDMDRQVAGTTSVSERMPSHHTDYGVDHIASPAIRLSEASDVQGESSEISYAQGGPSGTSYVQGGPSAESYAQGGPSGASYAEPSGASDVQGEHSRTSYAQGGPSGTAYAQGGPSGTSYAQNGQRRASYVQGEPSGASYTQGGQTGASYAQGGSSGASYAQSGPPGPSYVQGGPPGIPSAEGGPSGASYAQGEPPGSSYAQGEPSGASYEQGGPPGISYAEGGTSGASYAQGGPSETLYAEGGPSGASYAQDGPPGASYAQRGPSGASYAQGGPSGTSYAQGGPSETSYAQGEPPGTSYAQGGTSGTEYAQGGPSTPYAQGGPSGTSYVQGGPSEASRVQDGPLEASYAQGGPSTYGGHASGHDTEMLQPHGLDTHHLQAGNASQRSLSAPTANDVHTEIERRHTDQTFPHHIASAEEQGAVSQPMSSIDKQAQYGSRISRPPSMYPSSDQLVEEHGPIDSQHTSGKRGAPGALPPRSYTQPHVGRQISDGYPGTRSDYDTPYGAQQGSVMPQGSVSYKPNGSQIAQGEMGGRSQLASGQMGAHSSGQMDARSSGRMDGRPQIVSGQMYPHSANGQMNGYSQGASGQMYGQPQSASGQNGSARRQIAGHSQIASGHISGRPQMAHSEIGERSQFASGQIGGRAQKAHSQIGEQGTHAQIIIDKRPYVPPRAKQVPPDKGVSMKIKVSEREEYKPATKQASMRQQPVNIQSTPICHNRAQSPHPYEATVPGSYDHPQRSDYPTVSVTVDQPDDRPKSVKDFTCTAGSPAYMKSTPIASRNICDDEIPLAQPRLPSCAEYERRQRKTRRSTTMEYKEHRNECQQDRPAQVMPKRHYDPSYECALKRSHDSIACDEYKEQPPKMCYPPPNKTFTPKSAYRMDYTIKPYSRRSTHKPGKRPLSTKSSRVSNRFDNGAFFTSGSCRFFSEPASRKPSNEWQTPVAKMENCTCYKRDFIAHNQPVVFKHAPNNYVRPQGKFSAVTTYRLDYCGAPVEKVQSFKPHDEIQSDLHDSYFTRTSCAKQPKLDSSCSDCKINPKIKSDTFIFHAKPQKTQGLKRACDDNSITDNITGKPNWPPAAPVCTCKHPVPIYDKPQGIAKTCKDHSIEDRGNITANWPPPALVCNCKHPAPEPGECEESESFPNQDNGDCDDSKSFAMPPEQTQPASNSVDDTCNCSGETMSEKMPRELSIKDCYLPEKKVQHSKCGKTRPPMQSITNYRANFVAHGIPPLFHREPPKYVRPEGPMDLMTTYRMHFEDVVASPAHPFLPKANSLASGVFSGITSYRNDYINWHVPRTETAKITQLYIPPTAAFSGKTVYSEHFTTKCDARRKSKKAKQVYIAPGAFDGRTTYNTVFVNHGPGHRRLPAIPVPARQDSSMSLQKCSNDDDSQEDYSPINKQWSSCPQTHMDNAIESQTPSGKDIQTENKTACTCSCNCNEQILSRQRQQCPKPYTPQSSPFNSVEMLRANKQWPTFGQQGDCIPAVPEKLKKRRVCAAWNNNFMKGERERPKSPPNLAGCNRCREAFEMQASNRFEDNQQCGDQPDYDQETDQMPNTQQSRDKILNTCPCKNQYSNGDYSSPATPQPAEQSCAQKMSIEGTTDYKEATVPSITSARISTRHVACNILQHVQPPYSSDSPNECRSMSTYRGEYRGWDTSQKQKKALTAAAYTKPTVPFSGVSVYREHFVPHPPSALPPPVRHSDQFDLC